MDKFAVPRPANGGLGRRAGVRVGAPPLQVQDNFQLHKTDEEAIQYFRDLINTSMTAMFPQMFETMHKWAQYMRK
mgnify:CR=1 FL=1